MSKTPYVKLHNRLTYTVNDNGCHISDLLLKHKGKIVRVGFMDNKTLTVPKVVYLKTHGLDSIPSNYKVERICGNLLCINPEHLVIIAKNANNKQKQKAGIKQRKLSSKQLARRKLSPEQVKEIRLSLKGYLALSRVYDVSPATIRAVKENKIYKDVL